MPCPNGRVGSSPTSATLLTLFSTLETAHTYAGELPLTALSFRVGMAQILVEGGRPQANLGRAVEAIRRAALQGCRLVVLPECLDLGWTDPSARELAQPLPGEHVESLARSAREQRVYVA